MDTTLKMTRQGIRDLNSYGPRPKPVVAEDAAPAEADGQPVAAAPVAVAPHAPGITDRAGVTPSDGRAP
jgi:hypothetical protein